MQTDRKFAILSVILVICPWLAFSEEVETVVANATNVHKQSWYDCLPGITNSKGGRLRYGYGFKNSMT